MDNHPHTEPGAAEPEAKSVRLTRITWANFLPEATGLVVVLLGVLAGQPWALVVPVALVAFGCGEGLVALFRRARSKRGAGEPAAKTNPPADD